MLLKWPVRLDWGRSSISGLRESARRHTHDLSLAHLESLDVQSCSAGRGASATLVQRQVATARRAQLAQHIAQSSVRLRSLRPQHLVHVGDTFLLATQFVTVRYSNTASDPRNQQLVYFPISPAPPGKTGTWTPQLFTRTLYVALPEDTQKDVENIVFLICQAVAKIPA